MQFSQRLVEIMTERKITAYRIDKDIGISNRLIGYYRDGTNDPSAANLVKLANYFQVSVDYLLGLTDNPEINK